MWKAIIRNSGGDIGAGSFRGNGVPPAPQPLQSRRNFTA